MNNGIQTGATLSVKERVAQLKASTKVPSNSPTRAATEKKLSAATLSIGAKIPVRRAATANNNDGCEKSLGQRTKTTPSEAFKEQRATLEAMLNSRTAKASADKPKEQGPENGGENNERAKASEEFKTKRMALSARLKPRASKHGTKVQADSGKQVIPTAPPIKKIAECEKTEVKADSKKAVVEAREVQPIASNGVSKREMLMGAIILMLSAYIAWLKLGNSSEN